MARQGISKEQVYSAATALIEEGATPTVQRVRERLGSGSFSTISTHLADWKAENTAQAAADMPAIPEKVQEAFTRIWATAARSARDDVETQKQALEAMRREMDKERAEMAAEIERLETALEQTTKKTATLETDLIQEREATAEKDNQLTDLRIENARLDERVKASDIRAAELKDQLEALQVKFADMSKVLKNPPATRKKAIPARKAKES